MSMKDMTRLAKTLQYIFCHRPDEYGLFLDDDGSLPLKELLYALREIDGLSRLRESGIRDLILIGGFREFRIDGKKLFYEAGEGHALALPEGPVEPPKMLFFGARRKNYHVVMEKGILPGARRFSPLSEDRDTALFIAKRREQEPILVEVRAQAAAQEKGAQFYLSGEGLYLSELVPPGYLFGPAPPKLRPKKEPRPRPAKEPAAPPTPGSFIMDAPDKKAEKARMKRKEKEKREARREAKKKDKERKRARREARRRKEGR